MHLWSVEKNESQIELHWFDMNMHLKLELESNFIRFATISANITAVSMLLICDQIVFVAMKLHLCAMKNFGTHSLQLNGDWRAIKCRFFPIQKVHLRHRCDLKSIRVNLESMDGKQIHDDRMGCEVAANSVSIRRDRIMFSSQSWSMRRARS